MNVFSYLLGGLLLSLFVAGAALMLGGAGALFLHSYRWMDDHITAAKTRRALR